MPLATHEPMRRNMYIVRMEVGNGVIFESFVNTSRPTMITQELEGAGGLYRPYSWHWEPMTLNFGYHTTDNVIDVIQEWMSATNTPQPPPYGYEGMLNHSYTYKREVTIEMLDPTGIIVETHKLNGAYPISMEMNAPYDNDPELSITINMDTCELIL